MTEAHPHVSLSASACHRCGASLTHAAGQEPSLFCAQCGAPQLLFPDYLRAAAPEPDTAMATTGNEPPPRPRAIDWKAAIVSALVVAAVAAAFTVAGLFSSFFSFLSFFTLLGGASTAVSLYMRRRPLAAMDGRMGMRIGAVSGVLMLAALAVSLSFAGVISRFVLHRMGGFDQQVAETLKSLEAQTALQAGNAAAAEASQGPAAANHGTAASDSENERRLAQQKTIELFHSPEVRGGAAVFYLLLVGMLLVLFSAAGGAFAGLVRQRRRPADRLL